MNSTNHRFTILWASPTFLKIFPKTIPTQDPHIEIPLDQILNVAGADYLCMSWDLLYGPDRLYADLN